jgi:hypothetical protein
MKPYRPDLTDLPGGGVEQSFDANVVHVDDGLVAFGDLIPDLARGLPYGTPVHSLLIHLDENGPEMVEFNDQGNTVEIDALERVDLSRNQVRFVLREGAGLFPGRVSLAAEIEEFEDVWLEPGAAVELGAILVRFDIDDARFEALRGKLTPEGGGFEALHEAFRPLRPSGNESGKD